jgi:spore germination protein GerM
MKSWAGWLVAAIIVVVLGGAVWFAMTFRVVDEAGDDTEAQVLSEPLEVGSRAVSLYFARADGQGFVRETRTIAVARRRDVEVEIVLGQLLDGPRSKSGLHIFPEGCKLRQVFYDEEHRLLYLDFNDALVANMNPGSAIELAVMGSIMRTLAVDFPEIERVQILIDGLEVETLGGHLDLTRPLRTGDWL